jgi:hypothetical protein
MLSLDSLFFAIEVHRFCDSVKAGTALGRKLIVSKGYEVPWSGSMELQTQDAREVTPGT